VSQESDRRGGAVDILFVTTEVPSPTGGGGLIANYYHLRGLVEAGHRVRLVTYAAPGAPAARPPAENRVQTTRIPGPGRSTPADFVGNLFRREPLPIRRYMLAEAAGAVRALVAGTRFDLFHLASLHTAHLLPLLRESSGAPAVLYEHNVQSTVHELVYRMQRNPVHRWYAKNQWEKMRAYETEVCPQFDLVLAFSDPDAGTLRRMSPGSKVAYLPLAVDVCTLAGIREAEEIDLLWIGSFRWAPNLDSLRWFSDAVLPEILRRRPGATVAVAGSSPPKWVKGLSRLGKGVRVLGEVADAHRLMARSRVVIVPLRIGSGVRVKIIEALALGRAVLTTGLGCEGLELVSGTHAVIADDAETLAGEAVRVLEDAPFRERLGSAGRALALDRHDYRAVAVEMGRLYEALQRQRSRETEKRIVERKAGVIPKDHGRSDGT
jgi:glycosyltransferase involved in cell wall biosynthesis